MAAMARRTRDVLPVREDDVSEDETDEMQMDESKASLDESSSSASDTEDEIDDAVLEDMERFEQSFKNINHRYRLINRIGEGTFSTVYKAEDLLYEHYQNDWDLDADKENTNANAPFLSKKQTTNRPPKSKFVAIKKIYVTSSPLRILNELELLHDLREAPNVCPLITAFRYQDQVIAVLPFFPHKDFREYFREFTVDDMRVYLRTLFAALKSVHECDIIHRDIKPTNFLYSPAQKRGVLVDFGLAEREGTDYHLCHCCLETPERQRKAQSSVYASTIAAAQAANQQPPRPAYPASDQRSSRRANRAGTRGFRAPEVLLKCTAQTVLIDVWSCGVILLTFLSRRFPFFQSADDIDAFIELCCIFGRKRMKEVSLLHGQVMHTNISTITENGHGWEKILLWCTGRHKKDGTSENKLSKDELEAVEFMRCCLELDPAKRISAKDALLHPFLADVHHEPTYGMA